MSLPDLCLAPHEVGELAPGEPACAPATHCVHVRHPLRGGRYLLRQVAMPFGQKQCVARRQSSPDSPLLYLPLLPGQEAREYEKALRHGNFWRAIYVDANGRLATSPDWYLALYINKDETAYWYSRQGIVGQFKWQTGPRPRRLTSFWRSRTTAPQIERDILKMLSDADSDCAFSWRWVQISERERIESLYQCGRGTLQECERLLVAVLWSDSTLWKGEPFVEWSIGVDFLLDPHADIELDSTISMFGLSVLTEKSITPSSREWRLIELVAEHFALHPNRAEERRTVVQQSREPRGPQSALDSNSWKISAQAPTQHERLEARLHLRDWLHGKATPEEIPLLLGDSDAA